MDHPLHSSRRLAASARRRLAATAQRRLDEEEQQLNFEGKKPTPASISSIPVQSLEEIFCNFPVRILTQFKCVCKSWRDLISSEEFINLHLKKYKTSVILVNSVSEKRGTIRPVHPPGTPREAMSTVDFTLPESVNNKVPGYDLFRQITPACNGIICLWDMEKLDNIALWNPATKDLKIIPKPDLPRRSKFVNCRVVFGYDDVRNDYKIIQVLCGKDGVQFELYSLNNGLWKKLDISAVIKSPVADFSGGGIHSTGERIVCWLLAYAQASIRWELVLFDMSTERFEIVQVPVEVSKDDCILLKPYEGSIGVVESFSHKVWVLNDIYSPSGGLRSWRKVNLPIYPPTKLYGPSTVAFWEDYLLFYDCKTKLLILFDHGCQGFYLVGVSRYSWVFTAIRYKESLVRLL